MKRILLSAVLLSSIGVYAQVGINTTQPTAVLDVNGDVRVRSLSEEKKPKRVVTVDSNNVLKWSTTDLSLTGGTAGGFSFAGELGQQYQCNPKNDGVVVYVLNGSLECRVGSSWVANSWVYGGRWIRADGTPKDGEAYIRSSIWKSGKIAELDGLGPDAHTPVLYVIDDSQYRK